LAVAGLLGEPLGAGFGVPAARWVGLALCLIGLALALRGSGVRDDGAPAGHHGLAAWGAALFAALFYAPLLADPQALSANPDWAKVMLSVVVGRQGLLAGEGPPIWPLEVDGGFPQLGHPHDLFSGPFALPLLLLGAPAGLKALVVALTALGAAGMAALARHAMRLRPGACLLAGALFAVGAPTAAYIRSGSINKSFLLLLPWVLLGYHLGGRRGALFTGLASAAIALDAGWASVFAFAAVGAWVVVDRIGRGAEGGRRPGLRWWAGAGGLALALGAGKLAGASMIAGMSPVSLPKKTETVAQYFERASFFEPWRLPEALVSPVSMHGPFTPIDHDVFYLGLPAAALLLVGLVGARRRWRLAALTLALFFLASKANAAWGPFRLLLELAEPARGLWKLDKYAVLLLAMVLSLWAACGYHILLERLARGRAAVAGIAALAGALLVAASSFAANRPLVQQLFPHHIDPLPLEQTGCAPPVVVAVQAVDVPAQVGGHWHDHDALQRLLVVRDGGVVSGLGDFERAQLGAEPCALMIRRGPPDWRQLAAADQPVFDSLEPAPEPTPHARWREDGAAVPAALSRGLITAELEPASAGTVLFNLPYHAGWTSRSGRVFDVDGRLALELNGETDGLELELSTPVVGVLWGTSQGIWWLSLVMLVFPRSRARRSG